MHKIKWLYFVYLAVCLLVGASIAASFAFTRTRDSATLYGTYGGNLKTLDPAGIGDVGASDLSAYVYETLYDYAYGVTPYRLIPELAAAQPEISADGKIWVIRLKHGIHFYDPNRECFPDGVGPEVTAEDIVYSWKRVCNFQRGVTANYSQVFQGNVVGIDDWFAYTRDCGSADKIDWDRPVAGLRAVDRYTLRIALTRPFPQLQYNFAMMCTAVVSREAVDHFGDKFKNHPIGTGPFAMAQHLPDQQIVFVANPLYRGGVNVASGTTLPESERRPFVKRVQLNAFSEPLPPWYLFLQGQLDASAIPKDTFGQAIAGGTGELTPQMQADGIRLVKNNAAQVSYIGFNMADPVVGKNKPLRQAMSLAFDRQRYIDLYLNGRGIPANGPIPPGFPTYDGKRVAPYCRFDLNAAKAKLAEAERLNGGPIPPLHILYGSTATGATQDADYFTSAMRQIGLTVIPEFKPYGTFLSMLDRKQEQIFNLGWVADYPDEQNFWQLFYSRNAGPGGLNAMNYSNPDFDTLYERSIGQSPSPARDALYLKMQDLVLDDCTWLTTVYPVNYRLYHNWISNTQIQDYGHGIVSETRLDSDARADWQRKH